MAKELKKVTVKGAGDDNKVVLWDKDDAYEGGELLVSNNGKSYTVPETKEVKRRLSDGTLVEGDAGEVQERSAAAKTAETETTKTPNRTVEITREPKRNP